MDMMGMHMLSVLITEWPGEFYRVSADCMQQAENWWSADTWAVALLRWVDRMLHEACRYCSSGGPVATVCAASVEAATLFLSPRMTAGVSCTIKLWQIPSYSLAFRE